MAWRGEAISNHTRLKLEPQTNQYTKPLHSTINLHLVSNYLSTMANRTAQMKGQSYLDSPKGAGQKKKATQGESKVSTTIFY